MKRRDFLHGALAAGTVAITSPASAQTQLLTLHDFIRIRLCPRSTVIRRDVNTLLGANPNHQVIQSYRAGVAAMKALPDSNPTSWAYQANIHGTTLPFNQWPAGAPFATCQHNNAHFLPWHRMYLFFFEKMIRKHSGDNGFALPYWNYSKAGQASMPLPFRSPANGGNSLFDGTRSAAVNNGGALSQNTVNDATALGRPSFLGAGQFSSSLEGTPHGSVHVAIGGNMGGFSGAGRDPIFWLHHCNIDRLWEKWISLGGGHANPIGDANWMSRTSQFVDENGNFVTMVNSDVLDTVSQLKYQYEDPRECVPLMIVNWRLVDLIRRVSIRPRTRLVLNREWKIPLGEKEIRIDLFDSPEREEVSRLLQADGIAELAKSNRIVLRFAGLELQEPMNGYFEVYVSAGPREKVAVSEPVYVGNIVTFGADRESQRSMMQSPQMREQGNHEMGVSTEFDIGEILARQVEGGSQKESSLVVTLRPVTGVEEGEARLNEKAEPVFREVSLDVLPFEPE